MIEEVKMKVIISSLEKVHVKNSSYRAENNIFDLVRKIGGDGNAGTWL
jgi:hypothetical protein